MKKIGLYAKLFLRQPSTAELTALAFDIAAILLFTVLRNNAYLLIIVILSDVTVCLTHGAWLANQSKDPEHGPWRIATPVVTRLMAVIIMVISIVCQANGLMSAIAVQHVNVYLWYLVVIEAVCQAFRCILLTMNSIDSSWLEGANGRIGTPNWISILRMAIAVLIPHIYVTQPFGDASNTIATLLLAAAISTDAVDGFLARNLHQTTKAGKALDPLGDKVIFYPVAVAFFICTKGLMLLPSMFAYRTLLILAATLMVGRDTLFILWFFLKGKDLAEGIGASLVDKTRMVAMCVWLSGSALAITVEDTVFGRIMAWVSFACIIVVGILSVASLVIDYRRVRALRPR